MIQITIELTPPQPRFTPVTQAELTRVALANGWGKPGVLTWPEPESDSKPRFCPKT